MTTLRTNAAVTVTVRLPGQDWPEILKPPVHVTGAEVRLLRGSVTGPLATMVIRIEGSLAEIQEVRRYWDRQDFTVEEGDRGGLKGGSSRNPLSAAAAAAI